MNSKDIELAIQTELDNRSVRVLNKNAMQALLSSFTDPLGSLGKIFLGRGDALETERARIAQDIIIDLLCSIDNAISDANKRAQNTGLGPIIVSGRVEVHGEKTTEVTGVDISDGAGTVELKPGTHITASASDAQTLTGLKIGGKSREEKGK